MKSKSTIWILVFLFLILPLISSQLVFKQNTQVDVKLPCTFNGTTCSPFATCNATIIYPNGSYMFKDSNMTNKGGGMVNITLTTSNVTGVYPSRYTCTQAGYSDSDTFEFLINSAGTELTTAEGIVYIFFLIIILIIFGFTLLGAIKLPWKDIKNDEGKLVSVNDLRWVKLACVVFVYLEALFIVTIANKITEGYLLLTGVSGYFYVVQVTLFAGLFPLAVLVPWIVLYMIIANKKTKKFIERGLPGR